MTDADTCGADYHRRSSNPRHLYPRDVGITEIFVDLQIDEAVIRATCIRVSPLPEQKSYDVYTQTIR